MFCSRCGSRMNDNARFCTKCGFELKLGIPKRLNRSINCLQQGVAHSTSCEQNKTSYRWSMIVAIIIGTACYFIGSSLASKLNHYWHTIPRPHIDSSDYIIGIIGYLIAIGGLLSVLCGIKGLIAVSKHPPKDS